MKTFIAISPNHRCWHCERPLPADFCGVSAQTPMVEFVLVLCGERCQAEELAEIASCGVEGRALNTAKVKEILTRPEDMTVIEGQKISVGMVALFDDASRVCADLSGLGGRQRWTI